MIATVSRLALTLMMLAVLAGMSACGSADSDPEAEIRAWVGAMEDAAANEARRDIVAAISEAYADARGNSRQDIDNMLRLLFLRNDSIGLVSTIGGIEIDGGSAAMVEVTVGMAGLDDSALGISADAYRFELELTRDDDEWRLISARWGELGGNVR